VFEHGRAILISVLVEHDAGGRAGQQLRQLRLALAQRQRSKILAVELQQVERMEDRVGRRTPAVKRFEDGDAVGAGDRGLTVEGE
jgi:hypothetical protein